MYEFVPNAPYVFQSKKHKLWGKTMEKQFFMDFPLILWLKENQLISANSQIKKHLNFLLNISSNLVPTMLCPICQINKVKYLYVLADKIEAKNSSCANSNCRLTMERKLYHPLVVPIDFESLPKLGKRCLIRKVAKVFRFFYGLPRNFSGDTAYTFFKENYYRKVEPQKVKFSKKVSISFPFKKTEGQLSLF